MGSERENLTGQKNEEVEFEATKLVPEVLIPDPNQEAELLTQVNKTTHHGFAEPLKSYWYRRERSLLETPVGVIAA